MTYSEDFTRLAQMARKHIADNIEVLEDILDLASYVLQNSFDSEE